MKLTELRFENYRLFQKLDIPGLKRVNLITGKNNTGKTAFLEGIRIWAAKGDSTVVNHILESRGEFTPSWNSSYKTLFYDDESPLKSIYGDFALSINNLEIQLVQNRKLTTYEKYKVSIEEKISHHLDPNSSADNPKDDEVIYLPYQYQLSNLRKLWDNINLTHQEEDVLRIIKETVLPAVKRIGFSKDKFRILLETTPEPVPIGRFGDGFQRVLGIALALANSQNKILLIDEFESGLHHSIQKQLWELVLYYAKKWDIQVFITTHSEDTLRNFFYVGSSEKYRADTHFIRLQYSRKGILEAISYDMDQLEKALELELEIR